MLCRGRVFHHAGSKLCYVEEECSTMQDQNCVMQIVGVLSLRSGLCYADSKIAQLKGHILLFRLGRCFPSEQICVMF